MTKLTSAISHIKKFIEFIVTLDIERHEKVKIVKAFESFRVNVDGVLTGSSGANYVLFRAVLPYVFKMAFPASPLRRKLQNAKKVRWSNFYMVK